MADRQVRRRRQARRQALDAIDGVGLRRLFDPTNPLEFLSEEEVYERYRFTPLLLMTVTQMVAGQLEYGSRRGLPPLLQVLVTIRYLATEAFLQVIGDSLRVHTSTVSRAVEHVTAVFQGIAHEIIHWPLRELMHDLKNHFYNLYGGGFPNVIGCIDCTQVRIIAPTENENDYVNRKNFHSINVQMVALPDFTFSDCVARWPGSVHDSRIFRNSALRGVMERDPQQGLILSDSGYACKPYLMTPFLNPRTPAQERFNASLCKTRVMVEQSFGILKRWFSVLHSEVRLCPERACRVITTAVMLHNVACRTRDYFGPVPDDVPDIPVADAIYMAHQDESGVDVRNRIVRDYFS